LQIHSLSNKAQADSRPSGKRAQGMSLKIHLLGQFKLQANHLPLELPSRPAQSLLAYLALNAGVRHRREKLASLLWPEATETNARGYLRRALWQVRKSLSSGSLAWEDYLQISDLEVAFNDQSDYWLDVDLLLAREQAASVDDLIEIVGLYSGELLPGFYDQWTVLERERMLLAYHQKMNLLLECLIQSAQWHEALNWGEQWIQMAYSPEPAFRALMIAHAGLGDQGMVSTTYQRCLQILNRDLGLEPSPETQQLFQQLVSGEALPTILGLPEPATMAIPEEYPSPGSPPYKGLEYFDTGDAKLFFGREKLTAHLAGRLREGEQMLFVVGASGSGKSSLVRAGLIPALKRGEPLVDGSTPPEGSAGWLVHVIQPTAQPLKTLVTSLCRDETSPQNIAGLIDDLRQDSRSLHRCARHLCQAQEASRLLLVVDQFEELFTLCQDEGQRTAFIDNLLTAIDPDLDGPTSVVITLRADFYAHCAHHPGLRQQLAAHQEYIGPMSSEELRRAIEEPAWRGAWEFEPGLVDLILRDVRNQPGSLPLLSHALLETWRRRRGRILTLESYAESGSVHGAIARTAETIYQQGLDDAQQVIARQIFLRLTELGEESPETRRRAQTSELLPSAEQRPQVEAVLEKLVAARLVTVSEDYAEVSHEALIREWPTLRGWLEEDRQGFQLHRQLTEAALSWEAMDRDESALYRGARLASTLEWANEHQDQVNILEREFLAASSALAERRQQERERQLRRLRWLAAGLTGVLLLVILSAVYAFNQRDLAQREAHLASSRQYAAAALSNLDSDPELGILLSLEAVAEARDNSLPVPREAQEALHQSLQVSRLEMVIDAHPGGIREIKFSPDGERLVSVGKDRTLKIWDAASGQLLNSVQATNADITSVTYSPSGDYIATTDHDLTAKLWDSQTLTQITSFEGHDSSLLALAFSPDGERLVTSSSSYVENLFVWNIASGQKIAELGKHGLQVTAPIRFDPDNNWIAAATTDGEVIIWDATTYEEILRFGTEGNLYFGLAVSPDGRRMVASHSTYLSEEGYITIWDLSEFPRVEELDTFYAHADLILGLEFSPDGKRLATGSLDGTAKIWDASTGQELLKLAGHTDGVLDIAFHPSGETLATASMDGTIRIWNISQSQEYLSFPTGGAGGRIAFNPDGALLASGSGGIEIDDGISKLVGVVHVWNLETGEEPVVFSGDYHQGVIEAVAFNPDGSQLASGDENGNLKVWDVDSGQLIDAKEVENINSIYDVVYSPAGSHLAIGGEYTTFYLLDGTTLKGTSGYPTLGEVDGLAFSPDGVLLAATTRTGMVEMWNTHTGEKLPTISASEGWITDIAFSPDGEDLALASDDGTASIYQIEDQELQLTLRGHSAPVSAVSYSPDGRWIATASQDGSARLWDATSGQELLLLRPETGVGLVDVVFSPDGKMLATSGDDAVRVFLLETNDLVDLAKRRLSRDFTIQECQRFLPGERCENLIPPSINPTPGLESEEINRTCLFTDATGVIKLGFYHQAYLGVLETVALYDWDWLVFIPEPYEPPAKEFSRALNANCNLIITVGWEMKAVVDSNAIQYPEQRFLMLDQYLDQPHGNVRTVEYASDQGGFLAGYLAAAMTKSGVIGTFGEGDFFPVTDFMDGFEAGMHYYNQVHGTQVQLLGWDSAAREGLYVGMFNIPGGYLSTQELLAQGADVIFPVAWNVTGLGAITAVAEHGEAYLIGSDVDYTKIFPQFSDFILTSVERRQDISVIQAVDALTQGNFEGGNHLGTLETGEVDLAPFYGLETIITEQIETDLEQIKADIIAGKIQTKPED
jgi:WD40 repeat protein/basic membrane lipoprotein Med (substrate-binding protein (PBP1-ABC) superfamily)/DNA-binding SARP family transcriptional activator/energy-coupling factor transporter ATP-binding protein EcfA2